MQARIANLPNLPLFMKLDGRKAIVAGASEACEWKAELLAAAGANVVRLPDGWTADDLAGAAIALADLDDPDEAAAFAAAAHAAGAVVNVIDKPEFSDVQFGTIVNRAPIVIGISTDGAAPMLGQSIRARIEAVLPVGLSGWAKAAKAWRGGLKQRIPEFAERRRFWERFVAAAWREPERTPSDADFEQLVQGPADVRGRVVFIAADANDSELLTLKAVRALQTATVILYDEQVPGAVLELARREARRTPAGESAAKAVELARAGETVARVTCGDAAEEIAAARAAGVEVLVIPHVTAAGKPR
jgi:uroporphyrin-III C-methyltransferase/precorrin-2 dehydrogenase/sirohydrochlorin ferrochelatase